MATELGVAYLSIVADTRSLDKSIRGSLDSAEKGSEKSGSRIGGALSTGLKRFAKAGMVGAGIAVGAAITGGVNRALALENAQAKLSGLGHSADAVASIMDNALAAVKGTAFGMGEAGAVAASAVAAGVKPGKDLERTLKLVGDASTIAGTGMGEMGAIFNKVAASNKVQMDVINQLHDAGVPALSLLADQMGVTAEEASKMASAGKIDFETFQLAMEKGMGGAALKSGETTQGAFKNMLAALSRTGEKLISGVFPKFATVFTGITGWLDKLGPAATAAGEWLGMAVDRISATMGGLVSLLKTGDFNGAIREALGVEEDSGVVSGILWVRDTATAAFDEVRGGIRAMSAAWAEGGTDVTSSGFAGVLERVGLFARNAKDEVVGGVTAMVAAFQVGGTDVTSSGFAGFLESLGLAARNLWDAIGPAVRDLAPKILELATAFSPLGIILDGIIPVLPSLAQALGNVAAAVGGVLSEALPVVAEAFAAVGAEISGAIAQALPALVPLFESLAAAIPAMVPALTTIVPLIAGLAVEAIKLVTPLITNENTIKALVGAFLAWKVAVAGMALAGLVTGVVRSTAALGANTVAWVRNTAAAIASKAQAVALVAMYTGSFIVSVVRATASWVANTAAMVANKVAMVAQSVASKAVVAAQAAMRVGQIALNAAMRANPIGLVITAITALVGALVWFFTKTEAGKAIITAVWGAIKTAIKSVADWWTMTAWPAIRNVIDWFGAAFRAAGLIIATAWAGIRVAIAAVWDWINRWVFMPIRLALDVLVAGFNFYKDAVGIAWDKVRSVLWAGWDWISRNVFGPLKAGVALIGDAFSNVKDAIGTAWDGLKAIAAKPVNFILGTVYNDGIREWWNKIAGAVGLDSLSLPKASLVKFANGTEDHRAQIARGGAMRLWAEPETGGEAYIPLAQSKRGRSTAILGEVARRFGYGLTAYANGGIRKPETGGFWDNVGGVVSSIGRGVKSFGKNLWDAGAMAVEIIKDPIGAIKKGVAELMENAGTGGNSSNLFDIVGTLPAKFAGGLAEKVKELLGAQPRDGGDAPPAGVAGGALGVARMSQILKGLVPSARVTSGFRPGAITATGYPSMHGAGRAIDIGAASSGNAAGMMAIFNTLRNAFPNATELIYSPAGARQLYKGRSYVYPEPTRGMHYDHVHWAMANGGIIPGLYDQGGWLPDGGVGVNLTGKPEAVLTPEESAALKNGVLGGPLVNQLIVRDERTAIDELERLERRQLVQRRVTGVLR